MEVVLIESSAFQEIIGKIDAISIALENHVNNQTNKWEWIDNLDFQKLMRISKRTAQKWRDEGLINYYQIGSKIYYRLEDINAFMKTHIHPAYGQQ